MVTNIYVEVMPNNKQKKVNFSEICKILIEKEIVILKTMYRTHNTKIVHFQYKITKQIYNIFKSIIFKIYTDKKSANITYNKLKTHFMDQSNCSYQLLTSMSRPTSLKVLYTLTLYVQCNLSGSLWCLMQGGFRYKAH